MSERKDGGPAFPLPSGHIAGVPEGMTMRDYFAASALAGMKIRPDSISSGHAIKAYQIADAMLEERRSIK